MSSYDTSSGYFILPENLFFAYQSRSHLPLQMFPWLEDKMKIADNENKLL